jgi:ketosteroid isomerase-like protein
MDTREVIDRYYETVNAGDWDTWLTLFSDHLVVDEQLAGHIDDISVWRGAIDGIKKGYSKFHMTPEHVVIEDAQAAVVWHCEAANASGVPIDVHGANYFRVEGGQIVYMSNFHDKAAFAPFTSQKLD